MITNQQIEQKKRAEKQMQAAAEHRAKVRIFPDPLPSVSVLFCFFADLFFCRD